MEKTASVQLTQQEGQTIINLLDIAVRSDRGGLQVAAAALPIVNKLLEVFNDAVSQPTGTDGDSAAKSPPQG